MVALRRGRLRKKLPEKQSKIMDKIVERYESPGARRKRIIKVLRHLQGRELEEKYTAQFDKIISEIKSMDDPRLPFERIQHIVSLSPSKTINLITHCLRSADVESVDIKPEYPNVIWRILQDGGYTNRVFLVIWKEDGEWVKKWIVKIPSGRTGWSHIKKYIGGVQTFQVFDDSLVIEYCGLSFEALYSVAESPKERKLLGSLMKFIKKFDSPQEKRNITYNDLTKEIIIIDKY